MSLSLVLYALAVTALVSCAALLVEAALDAVRRPTRFVWLGAALLSTALVATAPARSAIPAADDGRAASGEFLLDLDALVVSDADPGTPVATEPGPWVVTRAWLPPLLGGAAAIGLLLLVAGATRLHRGRTRWDTARVADVDVRVAPDFGPAVVGLLRPVIVLPRHLLGLDPERLSMVLRHENEHRRARDPLLLAAGAGLLGLMPWNPAAWFQFRRLRRAVEIDCDARVLATGVSAARYGRLLLTLQGSGRDPFLAPALQEPASFLERRLRMMKRRFERTRPIRALGLTAVAGVLAVAACETPNPTAVAPVAPAERAVPVESTGELVLTEVPVGEIEAVEVPVEVITVEGRPMDESEIALHEGDLEFGVLELREVPLEGRSPTAADVAAMYALEQDGAGGDLHVASELRSRLEAMAEDPPLIVIDGVVTDLELSEIRSETIRSIELIKGAAAAELYGSRAANGVVQITTHDGPPPAPTGGVLRPMREDEYVERPAAPVIVEGVPTGVDESLRPLIIVDGVVTDRSLADLRSMDIAEIELVKGAAARELYGSRAANGVVKITTRVVPSRDGGGN